MVVQCNASGVFAQLNWDREVQDCVDLLYDFGFQCDNESGIINGYFGGSGLVRAEPPHYSNTTFMLQPGNMCRVSGQYTDAAGGNRHNLPEGTCTVGKKTA